MIVLLAALKEEAAGLRRWMALTPKGVAGHCPVYTGQYQGRSVLLAWTGMGRRRAAAGAEAVLARYRPAALISIGFSGALEGRLEVGDLVLASDLMGLAGPGEAEPPLYQASPALLRAATEALRAAPLRVVLGLTVTTPGIIATPAGKQSLGRQTGAVAVDMESYWLARAASERDIPFLALRAISDAQEDLLPPFHQILDAEGGPRARRLAAHLVREPGRIVALLRLARRVGQARRALTRGVACAVAAS